MASIKYGPYFSYVEDVSPDCLKQLRETLRYENPATDRFFAQQNAKYKTEQHTYLIDMKGKFYSGLINDAYKIVKTHHPDCVINSDFKYPAFDQDDGFFRVHKMPFKMRPYQEEAFINGIEQGRGIFKMATGAGKSLLIAALSAYYYLPTIIIVDSVDLCKQLSEEITQYTGFACGVLQGPDSSWNIQTINVAMIDSLYNYTKKKPNKKSNTYKFIQSVEVLIIDECHHSVSPSYAKVISSIKAPFRYGFTATPIGSFYKGAGGVMVSDSVKIKAMIGPVIVNNNTKFLIDQGWLSRPKIYMIENKIEFDGVLLTFAEEVERCITQSEERNLIGVSLIKNKYLEGKNVIVFVTRIEHGKCIKKMLIEQGVPADTIRYATGESLGAERKEMFEDYKNGSAKILIGTVLNEGLNFQCQVGVNMAGGYTPKAAIQRLGRVLRKPRSSSGDVDTNVESNVEYYDFLDSARRNPDGSKKRGKDSHPYFVKHGHMRFDTYKDEQHDITVLKTEDLFKEIENERGEREQTAEETNEASDFNNW
jgi:superfamily II DNA or RNA helicase